MAEAILKNLQQKVFDEVMTRADIPAEFGNREDLTKAGEELQRAFKDRLTRARLAQGSDVCIKLFILNDKNIHFKCDITMRKKEREREIETI